MAGPSRPLTRASSRLRTVEPPALGDSPDSPLSPIAEQSSSPDPRGVHQRVARRTLSSDDERDTPSPGSERSSPHSPSPDAPTVRGPPALKAKPQWFLPQTNLPQLSHAPSDHSTAGVSSLPVLSNSNLPRPPFAKNISTLIGPTASRPTAFSAPLHPPPPAGPSGLPAFTDAAIRAAHDQVVNVLRAPDAPAVTPPRPARSPPDPLSERSRQRIRIEKGKGRAVPINPDFADHVLRNSRPLAPPTTAAVKPLPGAAFPSQRISPSRPQVSTSPVLTPMVISPARPTTAPSRPCGTGAFGAPFASVPFSVPGPVPAFPNPPVGTLLEPFALDQGPDIDPYTFQPYSGPPFQQNPPSAAAADVPQHPSPCGRVFSELDVARILQQFGRDMARSMQAPSLPTGAAAIPASPDAAAAWLSEQGFHPRRITVSDASAQGRPSAFTAGPSAGAVPQVSTSHTPGSPLRRWHSVHFANPSPRAAGSSRTAFTVDDSGLPAALFSTHDMEVNPFDVITPDRVIRILRGKWRDYIPMDALTDEACRDAAFAPSRASDASVSVSADGELQLKTTLISTVNEYKITPAQWRQASLNFVSALRIHLRAPGEAHPGGPLALQIAGYFEAHFTRIAQRPDFEHNFSTYLQYDIYLRRQWHSKFVAGLPVPRIQDFHQTAFFRFNEVSSRARLDAATAQLSAATAAASALVASASANNSKSFRDRNSNTESRSSADRSSSRKTDSGWSRQGSQPTPYRGTTTAPLPVPKPPAIGSTPAPFAASGSTALNSALLDFHFPISSPLKHWRWTALLQETGGLDRFAGVPRGLEFGFSLGLEDFTLTSTFSPPNHYKTAVHHEFIVNKYAEEIKLGRVSPGYPPSLIKSLFGHYRTAPLNVIESSHGKLRITVDHSYPRDNPLISSVNARIDSKRFQCAWGTFSACYLLVADAPPDTEASVFDVDAAFRNIPTRPAHRLFTAIVINGLVHLDARLNFGICPAPGIFGFVADAIVWIYLHMGVDALIKWVDDFVFFRYPTGRRSDGSPIFSYDESLIWGIAADLGWPWAPEKFVPFSSSFTYIGFLWSLADKTVCLPDAKRTKYLAKLADWSLGASVSLHSTESLIGTLNHVTLVVPQGRSHLPSLYRFRAAFSPTCSSWTKHRVTPAVMEDIAWWQATLSSSWCGVKIVRPPEPLDTLIYVDASTSWGIGFFLNGKWLAWELLPGWNCDGRDIGWGEMVAVDLALRAIIASGLRDCHLVVRSDNTGVVGALAAGRSRNSQQNMILRRIVENFQTHSIWLTTKWVSTVDNIADAPSRGRFPPKKLLFPYPPAIPRYLKPFVAPSVAYTSLVA
ncbi:hypothetical protein D9615_001263 [Tricholomella constricta]|uniref:Uncharacterized protein n=1 Tax=Tricholomella constricta TaxID=117010 RepID=A0A8H5M8N1_9AGAR|nr:hypothetical protein D9615_001263 [Tricholomella constricta]